MIYSSYFAGARRVPAIFIPRRIPAAYAAMEVTETMPRQTLSYWKSSDGLQKLSGWAKAGKKEDDLAALCGVAPSTLRRCRRSCNEIDRALTQDGNAPEDAVEAALLKLATGFTVREERTKDGKNGEESTVVVKDVPPSFSAVSFWLRNRLPERWGNGSDDAEARSLDMLDDILKELEKDDEK